MPGTPTTVEVRVIAAGGKFLGNDAGGAEVTLRDALTGELLKHGRVRGGSGDVTAIMETARTWGTPIPVDDDAACFPATLDLVEPRLVEFSACGPLGSLAAARRVTESRWLAPGDDLTGELGVVLVIPGLLVQILSPATHQALSDAQGVRIEANVAMMCGCPITGDASPPSSPPGGPWPASEFDVRALIYELTDEATVLQATVPLAYAGTPSRFSGSWEMTSPGFYQAVVVARQTTGPNTGVDRATFFWPPATSSA